MKAKAIRLGTFVAAVALVLSVRDGFAQSSGASQRVFAGASAAWNIVNSYRCCGEPEPTGGALAIGAAGGFNFADRWSVQVEGEWPTSDQTVASQYTWSYDGQNYMSVRQTASRTPTVAVLFGVHVRPSKRVDLAFQFGPGWLNQRVSSEGQTFVNGAVTQSDQGSWSHWYWRVSVGGEAAVAVTPRVAVVAQLRFLLESAFLDDEAGFSWDVARPAVGVRVRF
jgi:hypothetical protein